MLRKTLIIVSIVLAGPAFSVLVISLGCRAPDQALGVMCGHNTLPSLVVLTLAAWLVLGAAAVLGRDLYDKE